MGGLPKAYPRGMLAQGLFPQVHGSVAVLGPCPVKPALNSWPGQHGQDPQGCVVVGLPSLPRPRCHQE